MSELPAALRGVAAFDLDGTLTHRDTLLGFLALVGGRGRLAAVLARHGLPLARSLAGAGDRDAVKEDVLAGVLGGRSYDAVAALGEAYALRVAAMVRPDAWRQVLEHRRRGHELVIVSASPAVYVGPVGRLLGAEAVLATELEVDAGGRLTGRLAGPNVRGPEKVVRLQTHLGDADCQIWAYGDSRGDTELLAYATTGCKVRRSRPGRDSGFRNIAEK